MSKYKNPLFYLNDILDSANAIINYVQGINITSFKKDRKTYSAVIREFEIIGEAVSHLPNNLLNDFPMVNWRDIKDFRNLLIHEYFGVDLDIVWNVIKDDLPILISTIKTIILKFQ